MSSATAFTTAYEALERAWLRDPYEPIHDRLLRALALADDIRQVKSLFVVRATFLDNAYILEQFRDKIERMHLAQPISRQDLESIRDRVPIRTPIYTLLSDLIRNLVPVRPEPEKIRRLVPAKYRKQATNCSPQHVKEYETIPDA